MDKYEAWLASPYGAVHKLGMPGKPSPQNIIHRLDNVFDRDEVISLSTRQLKSRAMQIFRSLPTNPHTKVLGIQMVSDTEGMDTPRDAMVRIVRYLLKNHRNELTARQLQALAAYDDAIKLEEPPVMYVAKSLGIHKSNASRLLKRAKIATFDENVACIDESIITWTPAREIIDKKRLALPRICAGGWDRCTGETQTGLLPLCKPCHETALMEYGSTFHFPQWLNAEIRRIRVEHYNRAKDACYKDYYGTMSIEETETYLDAA